MQKWRNIDVTSHRTRWTRSLSIMQIVILIGGILYDMVCTALGVRSVFTEAQLCA